MHARINGQLPLLNQFGCTNNVHGLEIFATCPQISPENKATYTEDIITVAQWSERAGCRGILVYTDN